VIIRRSLLARARSADEGATAVEYGLLVATITLLLAGILFALFGSIGDAFTYVTGFLS
jgi:Flp pilus assembly pilin Flp